MEIQTIDSQGNSQAGDLLYGVKAIAAYLGMRPNQAQHRCDDGTIPTFNIGRNVCARKSRLQDWIEEMAQE